MTPDSMKTNLTKLDLLHQYDLRRPTTEKAPVIIDDHATVASILKDKEGFIAPYKSRVDRVLKGEGYVSSCSVSFILTKIRFYPVEEEKEKEAVLAILNSPELVERIGKFFYDETKQLIASESYTLVGGKISGVDLVRRVLRIVPIHWVAIDLVSLTKINNIFRLC